MKTILKKVLMSPQFSQAANDVYIEFTKYYREVTAPPLVEQPPTIQPPATTYPGQLEWNGSGEKKTNFLWFDFPPEQVDMWDFKNQLAFAFSLDDGATWQKLPQLTLWPWDSTSERSKFGLYSTFVKKHLNQITNIKFSCWFNA
jgi:hypothetical protein